ncbi:hypothetical protein CHUAL_010250 [Chamberlinius hualienensis]
MSANTMRFLRRGSVRLALILLSIFSVAFYVYYSRFYLSSPIAPNAVEGSAGENINSRLNRHRAGGRNNEYYDDSGDDDDDVAESHEVASVDFDALNGTRYARWFAWDRNACPALTRTKADIDTLKMYPTLEFNPHYKEFWDENFEKRYLKRRESWSKLPLKVIIIPHSHNDPGWLKNFDGYFYGQTSNILNNIVDKLKQYHNMTFVWSEISFLAKWWKGAHHQRREHLKDLLGSGRLQILAPGWVMTDEATVHLYAMLDQMIEGHQWLKNVLNYTPKHSWSIDPFGHGSTVAYLLQRAGLKGTAIQRIHHGWKTKMAELQSSDFYWRQPWDTEGNRQLLTHNFPFDIYNIKHSCGPHTQVCLTFDFRKLKGEFTEYTLKAQSINQWNVRERAETLLAQYGRTASLFPHNVAVVLLGDDFRFEQPIEWDQQYGNYNMLINYINERPEIYHAHLQFGTLSTYMEEIEKRMHQQKSFPIVTGDFFVYSDVFSEGRPAYWSGYYTTRPFLKMLARELQATLRNAEVIYTLALARARQQALNRTVQILERDYARMTLSRQRLGDFQHHDATTGTSKAYVMHEFGVNLYEGIQLASSVMAHALQFILLTNPKQIETLYERKSQHYPKFLYPPHDRSNYATNPKPIVLIVERNKDVELVVSNTLGQFRQELIRVYVQNKHVTVLDSKKHPLAVQFTPVWDYLLGPFFPSANEIELSFIADLPPMSVVVFTLRWTAETADTKHQTASTTLYNHQLTSANQFPLHLLTPIKHEEEQPKHLGLENHRLEVTFDPATGLLDSVRLKSDDKKRVIKSNLSFQAYVSAQFHSGAYLFMPEPRQPVINVSDDAPYYAVVRGPIYSDVIVAYPNFLRHTVRIFHRSSDAKFSIEDENGPIYGGLFMENFVEYPAPPHFRETELFFRLKTDLDSGEYFYTDQNCFQIHTRRRLTQPPIASGPEANYYPLTCMMYVEDRRQPLRATLLVSHAHGGSSLQSGAMEVMLDRRSMYDDGRGLGEGVIDNKPTISNFWLIFEHGDDGIGVEEPEVTIPRPSVLALQLSNSLNLPPAIYAVDSQLRPSLIKSQTSLLTSGAMPCDVHLLNWKVLPVNSYYEFPSRNALLLLHRQGYACNYPIKYHRCHLTLDGRLSAANKPNKAKIIALQKTSISALQPSTSTSGSTSVNMADISVKPMEISAWNVTFA